MRLADGMGNGSVSERSSLFCTHLAASRIARLEELSHTVAWQLHWIIVGMIRWLGSALKPEQLVSTLIFQENIYWTLACMGGHTSVQIFAEYPSQKRHFLEAYSRVITFKKFSVCDEDFSWSPILIQVFEPFMFGSDKSRKMRPHGWQLASHHLCYCTAHSSSVCH